LPLKLPEFLDERSSEDEVPARGGNFGNCRA
jgi:hypothetical protein